MTCTRKRDVASVLSCMFLDECAREAISAPSSSRGARSPAWARAGGSRTMPPKSGGPVDDDGESEEEDDDERRAENARLSRGPLVTEPRIATVPGLMGAANFSVHVVIAGPSGRGATLLTEQRCWQHFLQLGDLAKRRRRERKAHPRQADRILGAERWPRIFAAVPCPRHDEGSHPIFWVHACMADRSAPEVYLGSFFWWLARQGAPHF